MQFRYKHVEMALAEITHVKSKDVGAFRAKVRHLRNIGLPQLPSPGSGLRISYSPRQVLEVLIALELEKVGHAPKSAAPLAHSITQQAPYGQHKGHDCFVVLSEATPGYTIIFSLKVLRTFLKTAPDVFVTINVSACVRKLDEALSRAVARF